METYAPPWFTDSSRSLDLSLASTSAAPRKARAAVLSLGDVLPALALADLRTIVSELVTNSVQHGTGQDIVTRIQVAASGQVVGNVSDGGLCPIAIATPRPAGEGGLGLRIVDVLAARWGVHAPSSDVWFELTAPAV